MGVYYSYIKFRSDSEGVFVEALLKKEEQVARIYIMLWQKDLGGLVKNLQFQL